jgi:beta-N-acetylhexosaminidase
VKAAIVGISALALTDAEAAMFAATPPAGVILFARNIDHPAQLAALIDALRRVLPTEAVLMVDQEGGHVARLRPPHWPALPPAGAIGDRYARDAAAGTRLAWLVGAAIGRQAAAFDVVTAPVLDLRLPDAHAVIGDRAFAADPEVIAPLGAALAAGLLAAGIQPVAKHIPGHGRATADSHLTLPRVETADLAADFAPFRANRAIPWAMTAHILYTALDAARPATLSPEVIGRVIRGAIGFQGVLLSDDLAMRALTGAPAALAQQALAAGCDIALHCTGVLAETRALLAACPPLHAAARARLAAARALAASCRQPLDDAAIAAEMARLLG